MDAIRAAVEAARSHRRAKAVDIVDEFVELLSMPNVSRDIDDVAAVASHIVTMLTRRGVVARTVTRPGAAPLVVGRYDVPGADRTVGFYAHYDGQPVDQPDWEVEPFKPSLYTAPLPHGAATPFPMSGEKLDPEWRIYARSASDDKAPIVAMVAALDAMQTAGSGPSANVLFLFEGEEEIGSPNLADYLGELKDELAGADLWLICDGPVHQTRQPQVAFGVRGISEMEITAYGPIRPLHSGHYGNWSPNPNMELARLLASMKDDTGHVQVADFYQGTQPITEADRAAVAALPDDDDALRAELGLGATEDGGTALALRLLLPSLNVRGLAGSGVGREAANVIPTEATASIDIRLAPGNDPEVMMDRIEAHVRAQGWHVVDSEPDIGQRRSHGRIARVWRKASYPGVRLPIESPAATAVIAAASVAASGPVLAVPTFGGSVPLHHFQSVLGVPIALTPFANHDNNQHAANENIRIANLWYGIDLMAALMNLRP